MKKELSSKLTQSFKSISLIAVAVLLVIKFIFYIMQIKYDLYFSFHSFNSGYMDMLLSGLIIIFSLVFLNLKFENKKKARIITILLLSIIVILSAVVYCFFNPKTKYYYFKSPDESLRLIVEEKSFSAYNGGNFYLQQNYLFAKYQSSYTITNDFQPFSKKAYDIVWNDDNSVTVSYAFADNPDFPYQKYTFKA